MKELMGGFWFAGLIAWAMFGFIPGTILIFFGLVILFYELIKEYQKNKAANNWRKNYPAYRY